VQNLVGQRSGTSRRASCKEHFACSGRVRAYSKMVGWFLERSGDAMTGERRVRTSRKFIYRRKTAKACPLSVRSQPSPSFILGRLDDVRSLPLFLQYRVLIQGAGVQNRMLSQRRRLTELRWRETGFELKCIHPFRNDFGTVAMSAGILLQSPQA
jgi:hypothetical protein